MLTLSHTNALEPFENVPLVDIGECSPLLSAAACSGASSAQLIRAMVSSQWRTDAIPNASVENAMCSPQGCSPRLVTAADTVVCGPVDAILFMCSVSWEKHSSYIGFSPTFAGSHDRSADKMPLEREVGAGHSKEQKRDTAKAIRRRPRRSAALWKGAQPAQHSGVQIAAGQGVERPVTVARRCPSSGPCCATRGGFRHSSAASRTSSRG